MLLCSAPRFALVFSKCSELSARGSVKTQAKRGSSRSCNSCFCGRRKFLESATTAAFLPICPSHASDSPSEYSKVLERFHPAKPDWYAELYASTMSTSMRAYEAEIADYKLNLFENLEGQAKKVVEIGIGTGANLKYYPKEPDVQVFGLDPNRKMEKYARAAADEAGFSPANFSFMQAVGEALPLTDESVDAVVGTLVLCSVSDVNRTLEEVKRVLKPGGVYIFIEHVAAEDGTLLRFAQTALDPLQQLVADGCHLTRETGKHIATSGFAEAVISRALIPGFSILSPHIYGVAHR